MAWEIKGTVGSLESLPNITYQSRVSAPKNPKLIRENKKARKLTPSAFLKEMSMDTKEKLASTHEMYLPRIIELLDMGETSLQKNTQLVVDEPMFQPYPSEIYFQKFEPFTIYEVPLLLRNNDKVPRLAKVTQVDTPYFKIITSSDAHQKVGPGLPVIYKIQFLPEENKDYNHELIVSTEREKFVIPIKCIGSRAILDFPDEINFSVNSLCPVKYLNSKVLLIRNIGNKDAKFSLKVDKPFSIQPDHGILPIGENMQVTVDFQPIKCGEFKKDLTINYDSSETVYVSMYGSSQDMNVRLDKNSLRIEDTYITMTNQRTVTIHNRSDIIVHYEWKKFATIEEEEQQKLKEMANLNRDEENAKNKLSNQSQDYIALLSRNFQNKIRNSQNKPFHFDDNVFLIQPIEGDIWPNSSVEVSVIFRPDFAQTYNKTAYCEVTGRESRLPLRLHGIGSGPKVQLSIENLDVGSIFIGSTHVFEVVLANKGFIDAIYSVIIPNTQFGKFFSFEPNEGLISPSSYQAVCISFGSNKLGSFNEIFEFAVDGKLEKYKLNITGTVIPPTFKFDTDKIRFNQVSYGFKYSHNCVLKNTSLVPMTFNLRVASDSEQRELSNHNLKEFSIKPSTSTILPQSDVKILIEFVPNFIKKYETSLVVDIEDVANELMLLPITARSGVPNISLLTDNIDMGRCFIYHQYEKHLRLSNETTQRGRYIIIPSNPNDSFKFSSSQSEGIIEPNSIKEISLIAEAVRLNEIECDLLIKINGSLEPALKCHFSALSQGPVALISPRDIDWGPTTVLNESSREILITNESLIEANFSTSMMKKHSPWRLEPAEGSIEPGSEIKIKAICHLIDKIKYEDVIIIDIEHSNPQHINVKATGGGSSIVSEPNIGNFVDFGTYFSGGTVKRTFKLTNKSSRFQSLSFIPDGRSSINLNKKELLKEKAKNVPPMMFKVVPTRVELCPGETKEIIIEGYGAKPQLVEEILQCFSIIGKTSGKDRIMRFKLRCEFIAPLVSFSTRDIIFRCEHDGSEVPVKQVRPIIISNISSLDVTAHMNLACPFFLVDEETGDNVSELQANIKTGESLQIKILFDTSFKKDLHNEIIDRVLTICYAEHQHNDLINLTGQIYFPNIHFETDLVDFGCILNNTEVCQDVKMTNIGPLTVNYKWKFIYESDNILMNQRSEEMSTLPTISQDNLYDVGTDSSSDKSIQQTDDQSSKLLTSKHDIDLPSIEELFDISPLYGILHSGESQNIKVNYYGHKEIKAYVRAVCEITNGPSYDMVLRGEASVLNYEISDYSLHLDYIPFDEVAESFITIKNLGKVGIEYSMVGFEQYEIHGLFQIEPEKPMLVPPKGYIEAENYATIAVQYLPGIPRKFSKKMLIQVSHFAPEEIIVSGDAGFIDIMLDLPRWETEFYKSLVKEAIEGTKPSEEPHKLENDPIFIQSNTPELDLQIEIDRLSIQQHVEKLINEQNKEYAIKSDIIANNPKSLTHISEVSDSHKKYSIKSIDLQGKGDDQSSFINLQNSRAQSHSLKTSDSSRSAIKRRIKPILPDYLLDFGHVILGTVKTHVIRAANMGKLLASFEIERQNFSKTGFSIDLERVKNLPNEESVEFVVTFDPRGANLVLGPVEHVIPINITNGPIVNIRLRANVTMPDLQISNDVIDFGEVKCGECKIITVQVHNYKEVRCDWSASYFPKREDKFTPMHLKRKKKGPENADLSKPRTFEIMPPTGILLPSQKINIQLKFMPTEEKLHEERVTIRMAQSSQRLMILCKGKGLEPRIDLSKNSLEFEPILPHSQGDEQEVRIVNPCPFPVEIYNLEFDKNYLDEEKILRIIRGYDEFNTILLPPRYPGDKLPNELYDYFEDLSKKLDEEEKKQKQQLNESLNQREMSEFMGRQAAGSAVTEKSKTEETLNKNSASSRPVGDVEKNPVFDSIAQYLGIDLSTEGRAARNRRGVAIVVNGPPLSGKSRAAIALAKYYECALLTIDSIITDAIANSSSTAATKVRQLCADTAAKHAEETRALEALEQAKAALINNGGLSIEALAQHSISQAGGGGGIIGGSKKTSVAGDSHTNVKNLKKGGKLDIINNADQSSNHPSTPPPLLAPIARKLSISTHLYSHDDGYMSTVLPEDLIVDLLSERLQLSDCSRGVIIDGLETLFAQNYLLAASAILKSFNNRRYIYCFTMKSDFKKYLEQQNKILEDKLKAEKEKELQEKLFYEEMDEETYQLLPEEKRKEIDDALLETKRYRLKKDAEEKAAAERERIEREQAEQVKLEEEKKKKKGGPGKPNTGKDSVLLKPAVPNTASHKPQVKDIKEVPKDKAAEKGPSGTHNPPTTNRPETRAEDEIEKSKVRVGTKMAGAIPQIHDEEQPKEVKILNPEEEKKREAEKLLQQRFKTFDLYSKEINSLMELWDRSTGSIFRQASPSEKSEHEDHQANKRNINKRDPKAKEKDSKKETKEKPSDAEKIKSDQIQSSDTADAEKEELDNPANGQSSNYMAEKLDKEEGVGVPHILVEINDKAELDELHKHPKLPQLEEVLDGMGLGPKGPPIPPPAIFSVVPYPVHRKSPPGAEFSHYVFVTTNENDPNLVLEEIKSKDLGLNESANLEGEKTPDNSKEPKNSIKSRTPKAGASRNESSSSRLDDNKRRTSGGVKAGEVKKSDSRLRTGNAQSPNRGSSSLSGNQKDDNQDGLGSIDGSLDKPSQKLQRFRWIIPQSGELVIRLRFTSEEIGQFDQTLNFEIVGTRRRYQLHCRGVCTFPSISREPRIVFPNRKKNKEKNEIVNKKFILAEDIFEFGPLLVGNNRERCREGKFPEYTETLTIHNSSPLDADVSFCFLEENIEKNDGCFFMEPNEMSLKANETKHLKLFATPKENRLYEDTLICCIKENPEPITFRISCVGQKPELVLDKKEFNFKQVLLHRKESKDIKMTNNTMLAVQWRIEGADTLGDEFICNQTSGVIEPFESFNLILHFRAIKPLTITQKEKKILKVLVSSLNSFLGFMENHVITVLAEAYDVALEINLPKGNDGGLDFGSIRVNSESKLNCTLKNKGKYPIKFNFITEAISPETTDLLKYVTISPAFGELPSAHDRNSQNQIVTVSLIPKKQILIKDAPVLKCQITEPSSTEGPAVIANIPIKITAKAVVSEFNIIPHAEVNFGPLSVNSKRQEKIVIENKGELDFKFTISKYSHNLSTSNDSDNIPNAMSRQGGPKRFSSSMSKASSRRNSVRDGVQNQGRLQVGIYTVTPAFAIILQNGHQVITIDCAPEQAGKFEEEIMFDITDRNMQKYPNGIMYKLNSEAVLPCISNSVEMFEEHTIIPNISALNPKMMSVGIYAEEENKFFFNNVIVGRTAKARFKLINPNKIPIDLNVALKSPNKTNKSMTDTTFEIEPQRVQIMPFGFSYTNVSFSPTSMASYNTLFEVNLENTPNSIKPKPVTFEISGDGNLPRFTILKPSLRNKKGQSLMLFKRCVINSIDTQQLILANEGSLATKINFYLIDPDSAFKFKLLNSNEKNTGIVWKDNDETISSAVVQPNSQVSFQIVCTPRRVQSYQASLQLTVTDNQFEDTLIQMIGEGYMEDVIFENLHSLAGSNESEEDVLADEDVSALKCNSISFGDVYINEKKQLIFTMKNQSKTDCVRFEWPTTFQILGSNNTSAVTIGGFNTSVNLNASSANLLNETSNMTNPNTATILNETQNAAIQFSPRVGHLHAGCAKDITITFKAPEPKLMRKELFNCNLTKIMFDQPIHEVKDWDDRISQVKWVNEYAVIASNQEQFVSSVTAQQQRQLTELGNNLPGTIPTKQIIRKKVIETEPEPRYTKIDEQVQPMELFISANCDYCKYRCRTSAIRFKDTLMFQTRVYEVSLINRGKIQFDYNWKVIMEDSRRPFTPMIQPNSPTPESSASPRGRGSKISKGGFDTSPSRKANGGKDSIGKDSKGKDANKTSLAGSKKAPPIKETAAETEPSKSRGGPSRKGKAQDKSDLDESMSYNKKSSDLMEASFKLNQNDLSDLATSRTIDEGQLGRPESQMMRAESSLSHYAPSSISETGYVPFSVEPNFGKLEPGKTQTFKVKFAPLNVNDYQARILCQIPNTEDGKVGPMIAVKGRGLLPYCHMELEESDYLTAGRRDPDLPGPSGAASGIGLDQMTKVIEFNCIGLETKSTKTFEMINPTNTDYSFEWIKEDQNDAKKHDQFTCLTSSGTLISGKKFEISFEFEPNSLETQESFWKFRIPKYDLTVPFLLVGHVSEPKVLFERSHITFKQLLVGKQGREVVHLINQEKQQLTFQFDQTSCYTEGRSAVVIIEPATGVLEPGSKMPITLSFQPREQRTHTFNLKCKVSHLSKPLNLNVKGEGFQIQTSLYCEDTVSGNKIEFVDNSINEIHMGEVEKNETCFRNLFIFNSGKHTANFEWALSSQYEDALSCFTIEPKLDQVEPGDKKHVVLKYTARHERSTIANMILKIENGSVYHIHLDGIGVRPDLFTSFNNYDFGHCFIYKAGMKIKTAELQLLNRGNKDLNISCLNNELVNKNSCFQFDFKQLILQPGKLVNTQVNFIPRESKKYSEQIILELNGLTRREILLTGVGAQLKVELVDPKQKCFDLNTLQIGKQTQKKLQIINRSTAPIDFNLLFEPRSEYLNRDLTTIKIEPFQNISLRAGQTQELMVKFSPKFRIPKFVEDLNIEYNGINLPLCTLQGACHGYNIWLDTNQMPFGAVSQKCSTVKRLVMHNDGDIGSSFKWELERMKPEFSIYPVVGYISPGMEVNFDITYNPTELTSDLRKDNIKCFIEGGIQPLLLTLTGSCIQVVAQKETHNFDTFVRQRETKLITISNRSNVNWEIKPLIEGEYFSGLESFTVEYQSTCSFEIVYFPMTMTQANGPKHTGSIFFPLPDGTGILYNLSGTANPPKPMGKIVREVPCKTAFTEVLPVENWLKKLQRFKVSFEIIKPEKPDPSTTLKGNDYIDVPGNGKKEYKLNYFAHKENLTIFKVVFKNEQTNEYCFYEMSFKSFKGNSVGSIDLTTQVRVAVSHSIKLENPLNNMVTFAASCSNNTEVLIPASLTIAMKSQGEFNFEYLPLKAGEINTRLELSSNDLGINIYDLTLKALPASSERPIIFKTSLGSSQTLAGKILNFCRQKTEYTCKIDNSDFKIDKTITAAPSQNPSGIEVSFEILFEPSSLTDARANLTLTSPIGGDYLIPLIGTCSAPKPQGPFNVKANTNTGISFKNVFTSSLTFSFAIDNPLFHVTKPTETLKPHQIYKIMVGFDGNDGPNKADVMAKLVVTAPKSAGVTNNIQWIYYLKGTS